MRGKERFSAGKAKASLNPVREPIASDLSPEESAENYPTPICLDVFWSSSHRIVILPAPACRGKRTQISYFTALPAATYAAFRIESRMKSTEVTVFDRKSVGAEGSAVRPGSHTKVSVPLVLPQNRHPERSASQIYRVIQRLCGAESKDLGGACFTHGARSFSTTGLGVEDDCSA
jgi:hypothetical protein